MRFLRWETVASGAGGRHAKLTKVKLGQEHILQAQNSLELFRRPGRSCGWMLKDEKPAGLVLPDAEIKNELEMHERSVKLLLNCGLV